MPRRRARSSVHHAVPAHPGRVQSRLAGPRRDLHRLRHLDDALHRDAGLHRPGGAGELRQAPHLRQPRRGDRDGRGRHLPRRLPGRDPDGAGHGRDDHRPRGRLHALPRHGRNELRGTVRVRHPHRLALRRHRRGGRDRRAVGGRLHPRLPPEPRRQRRHGCGRERDALHRHGRAPGAPAPRRRTGTARRGPHLAAPADDDRPGLLPAARRGGRDDRPPGGDRQTPEQPASAARTGCPGAVAR